MLFKVARKFLHALTDSARPSLHAIRRLFFLVKNIEKDLSLQGGVRIRGKCVFGLHNKVYSNAELTNVSLGDMSYIGRGSRISNVKIGKFSSIGPDVLMGLGRHPSRSYASTHPAFYSTASQCGTTFSVEQKFQEHVMTTVGNDVWIGARVIVVDGVVIGDGAIIGAGSVVTRDVPPFSIVAGTPARKVRSRFELELEREILRDPWWDRQLSWISQNSHLFHDAIALTQVISEGSGDDEKKP
jgi:acetyltransferase-like isoleucine patch superfamily enzyme